MKFLHTAGWQLRKPFAGADERDALGWDIPAYNAVKDGLVTAGKILTGRGRGGSVTINK